MNDELREKTEQWMQLERKTLEQRKLADQFYDANMMKLIEEDFIDRNGNKVFETVDNLVISVGTSYEPIVLNISLLLPGRILFIYTEKSEETLDKVIEYCNLKAAEYDKQKVNEIDPIDIYRVIKQAYMKWERPERMYIDFTGGTKAMSAAAALAGAMINVQMVYVASDDYLVDFRKPNPGSENLIYIDNPLAVFGDLEIDKAIALFKKFNFSGARERLESLQESIPDPDMRQQLHFIFLLADAYDAWDALEFGRAWKSMAELYRQLKRDVRMHPDFILADKIDQIKAQEDQLKKLSCIHDMIKGKRSNEILNTKEIIYPLMFTMYMNAETREQQGKLDMATLLIYRLLEMIEQRRLSGYGLFVSEMHYEEMKIDEKKFSFLKDADSARKVEWLRDEVRDIRMKIYNNVRSVYLPDPVSLLDGFIILAALKDPLMIPVKGNSIALLKRMRSVVHLRNNSIFAHGLGPVGENDYIKFRDFVLEMFKHFCKIEKIKVSEYKDIFTWIMPDEIGKRADSEVEG